MSLPLFLFPFVVLYPVGIYRAQIYLNYADVFDLSTSIAHGKNGYLSISKDEIWGKRHADKFPTKSGLIRYQKEIKPGKVSTLSGRDQRPEKIEDIQVYIRKQFLDFFFFLIHGKEKKIRLT